MQNCNIRSQAVQSPASSAGNTLIQLVTKFSARRATGAGMDSNQKPPS